MANVPINAEAERRLRAGTSLRYTLTTGLVVDTNDPQQMGRIRVSCSAYGDSEKNNFVDAQWAMYISPFGGSITDGTRGPEEMPSKGPVSYGMWMLPKIGSYVLVGCLDGNPSFRYWLGCLHTQFGTHTLPAGRWLSNKFLGPLTSNEEFIEPAYTNARKAYGDFTQSDEWKTRVAEGQAAGVADYVLDQTVSKVADERNKEYERQGYQKNRQTPDAQHPLSEKTGGATLDSQMFSITTPGQHAFIMDDDSKNGRIRIKTASGNQVILDDTNERVYISTAEGENYIEMDGKGNMDVFTSRRLSFHARSDINFTTPKSFRISCENFHVRSKAETRIHADTNLRAVVGGNTHWVTEGNHHESVTGEKHTYVDSNIFFHSNCNINIFTEKEIKMTSVLDMNLFSYSNVVQTGAIIHLNGPSAKLSDDVTPARAVYASSTNRIPVHEPWSRSSNSILATDKFESPNDLDMLLNMTWDSDIFEHKYESVNNNKIDLGDNLGRNKNWRR